MQRPQWQQVDEYTRDDLIKDFKGKLFTLDDFVTKGKENYDLKESTCKQKLRRGVREVSVVKRGHKHYQVII